VTERLTWALAWVIDRAARLLPPGRRHWAKAVQAEAGQVPAGWPRLGWLAGGVWLVAREARMARKIGYWIGAAAVTAAVAWVVWLSWRVTDPESGTDRIRVGVGAIALIGLPWVARRSGLFGPVSDAIAARLVRVAGCAAICGLGLGILRVDRHVGLGSVLGSGKLNWGQEAGGLVVLIVGLAAPLILKARRPQTGREVLWGIVACAAVTALLIVPLQALVAGYVAMIFAATSRRSPVAPPTLTAGLIAGIPTAAVLCALLFVSGNLYGLLFLAAIVALLIAGLAGAAAASLVTGIEDPDELRAARIRQGTLAGATAGAVGGLASSAIFLILGAMMVAGPLVGMAGGALGAAIAADHRLKSRPARSIPAGQFAPNS
jgi:hypothetical protein